MLLTSRITAECEVCSRLKVKQSRHETIGGSVDLSGDDARPRGSLDFRHFENSAIQASMHELVHMVWNTTRFDDQSITKFLYFMIHRSKASQIQQS